MIRHHRLRLLLPILWLFSGIGMLHAGDLFSFIDALRRRTEGLFEVRGCDLRLESSEPRFDTDHANVSAYCLLSWYTLGINEQSSLLDDQ